MCYFSKSASNAAKTWLAVESVILAELKSSQSDTIISDVGGSVDSDPDLGMALLSPTKQRFLLVLVCHYRLVDTTYFVT